MKQHKSILLIEDEIIEYNNFKLFITEDIDIETISITEPITKVIDLYKNFDPDLLIIDIDLNSKTQNGSNINFLQQINNLHLKNKQLFLVITNILSKTIYDYLYCLDVDLILYKGESNYSVNTIIKNILILYSNSIELLLPNDNVLYTQSNSKFNISQLSNKINNELDLIGISSHLIGRTYIYDAIIYLLQKENETQTVYTYLSKKYKKSVSGICRAIQTAIYRAWRTLPINEIEKYYTTKYCYERGVPLPTEFLFYYVEKIRKSLLK